jgi:SAM-dependent methyltransferase
MISKVSMGLPGLTLVRKRLRSFGAGRATNKLEAGCLHFRCNICGQVGVVKVTDLDREVPSCLTCGSTLRFRSLIRVLSVELFGKSLALPDFPVDRTVKGIGMTDWEGYASGLAQKFDYRNTSCFHEPKLDITDVPSVFEGAFDFVICSDVFEHVVPPVSVAFENARKLLKPQGVLIFSVPYTKEAETAEHFPELFDYQLQKRDKRYVLENITRSGETQVFDNLVFHGGPSLEMRVFSESSLLEEFQTAGFGKLKIYQEPDFEHGIYWYCDWSLPMAARIA